MGITFGLFSYSPLQPQHAREAADKTERKSYAQSRVLPLFSYTLILLLPALGLLLCFPVNQYFGSVLQGG